jgi:hypothetical protein
MTPLAPPPLKKGKRFDVYVDYVGFSTGHFKCSDYKFQGKLLCLISLDDSGKFIGEDVIVLSNVNSVIITAIGKDVS